MSVVVVRAYLSVATNRAVVAAIVVVEVVVVLIILVSTAVVITVVVVVRRRFVRYMMPWFLLVVMSIGCYWLWSSPGGRHTRCFIVVLYRWRLFVTR